MNIRILILMIAVAYGSELHITPIKQNPGIYFEELGKVELYSNEWKVVVYYELKSLAQALNYMNKHVVQINNFCNLLHEEHNLAVICNSTVSEMIHLMSDITHKYSLLQSKNRQRRALFDAIGIVSKSLFGTLNEEDVNFMTDR